jgi:hypothetical protein
VLLRDVQYCHRVWKRDLNAHSKTANINIATYLLKARTAEPEKESLLVNGSETTFVSRQRLCKHVCASTDTHATKEMQLETVFSTRSVQRGYKEENSGNRGGVEYLHCDPASRRRQRKGKSRI